MLNHKSNNRDFTIYKLCAIILLLSSNIIISKMSHEHSTAVLIYKSGVKLIAGAESRWDFLQGELSLQRRMTAVSRSNGGKGYRRKLQKKLMHHKQQLEDLEVAKKAFQASTQVSGLPQLLKAKVPTHFTVISLL